MTGFDGSSDVFFFGRDKSEQAASSQPVQATQNPRFIYRQHLHDYILTTDGML